MPVIAVQNKSTVVDNATVDRWCVAIGKQADALVEAWGVEPAVIMQGHAPRGAWKCTIADHSDVKGALGYHEDNGHPSLWVFVADCIADGASPSVDLSHEVLEALVDPECVWGADLGGGLWVAREVCDPVEADEDGYEIDGILVSDFVLPAWFDPTLTGKVDFRGHLTKPLTLSRGGYVSLQRNGQWTQKFARSHHGNDQSRRGRKSRRHTVREARPIVGHGLEDVVG